MSFDLIAPHYRWLESVAFANRLQNARLAFLDQIPRPRRVLIAGEGNGRFLREFARRFPEASIDCVDASVRMLRLARSRLAGIDNRIQFIQSNLLNWSPEENAYDLVVTHFFLDCFDECELEKIVETVTNSATRNAIWLLADFSIPSGALAENACANLAVGHAPILSSSGWNQRARTYRPIAVSRSARISPSQARTMASGTVEIRIVGAALVPRQ